MSSLQLISVCVCVCVCVSAVVLQTDGDAVDPRTDQEEERRRGAH